MQSNLNQYEREHSLEEQCHREECRYCSDDKAISLPFHSDVQTLDRTPLQSWALRHAVERYLSPAHSSHDYFDTSSASSEQHRANGDSQRHLNLCEINEIIYSIHSDIDDSHQRNEILQSLATSLRQVAEQTPIASNPVEPLASLDQSLDQTLGRAMTYELVMKLFSFYLLLLTYCAHLL